MSTQSKPQTLTYRGETWQVIPALDAWGTPALEMPGGPLYDLLDGAGERRYTLWWVDGQPNEGEGRVLSIQAYTKEHPYPLGIWRRGESFIETTAGFRYQDERYRAVISRMPLTEQVIRETEEAGENLATYVTRQVDACLAEGVLTLIGEPDPQATRGRWIRAVTAVFQAHSQRR